MGRKTTTKWANIIVTPDENSPVYKVFELKENGKLKHPFKSKKHSRQAHHDQYLSSDSDSDSDSSHSFPSQSPPEMINDMAFSFNFDDENNFQYPLDETFGFAETETSLDYFTFQ